MDYLAIILTAFFGLLAAVTGMLAGSGFSKTQQRRYPFLQKFHGKRPHLTVATVIFATLTYSATVWKDFLTVQRSLVVDAQGPRGAAVKRATLVAFKQELRGASRQQIREAQDYFDAGEHDFAQGNYLDAAWNYQKSIYTLPTMSAHLNLSQALSYMGRHSEAIQILTTGLRLSREQGNKLWEGYFLGALGTEHALAGNLDNALSRYKEALELAKQTRDRPTEASNLNNLGNVYLTLNNLDAAKDSYQSALKLKERLGDKQGEADTLLNIGRLHMLKGEKESSLKAYQRSAKFYKEMSNYGGEVFARQSMAFIHQHAGEVPESLDQLTQARDTLYRTNGPKNIIDDVEAWIQDLKNPVTEKSTASAYDDWEPYPSSEAQVPNGNSP